MSRSDSRPDYPLFYRVFLELDFPGDWNTDQPPKPMKLRSIKKLHCMYAYLRSYRVGRLRSLRIIFGEVFTLTLLGAMLCAGCSHNLPPTTRTQFAPPTTAPSVTPAAKSAQGYIANTSSAISQAQQTAQAITPANADASRAALSLILNSAADSIGKAASTIADTISISTANDAAVQQMAKERDDARTQVHALEDEGAKKDQTIADQKVEIKEGKAKADAAIRARNILIASIIIGGAVAFGIYEAGCGLVISLIVGALAFAAVPIVATSLWFQIAAGVAALVVIAFAVEMKFKGGFAAALHDKFKVPEATAKVDADKSLQEIKNILSSIPPKIGL